MNGAGDTYTAPDVSQELLPVVIDRLAEEDPDGVFVTLCTGNGNEPILFRQYANAINRTASWLERQLGRGDNGEGLAYLGTGGGDIYYAILLVAAVKAGYFMLFNSPRNSVDAHINLFVLQGCNNIVAARKGPPQLAAINAVYPMNTLHIPSIDDLLNGPTTHYGYDKTFKEARRDALVSLNTSGSTGLPKPVLWTLGAAAVSVNAYMAPTLQGTTPLTQSYREDLIFSAMPTFHAAGLLVNILSPIYCRHRVALPPPGPPLSADVAIALIRSSKATAATLPPSTVDEIGKRPPLLATMAQLNYVVVGGGMVSKIGGDAVAAKTKMINILGTTEFGAFPLEPVDSEDWQYFHFSPLAGTEFRHISDEQYELVVVREKRLQKYQSCFEIFPDLQELSSHDLFSKHPTKSNLWFYSGRSDDVIVFLNGEKTNPVSMEELVSSRPEVRNALVVGHGRFEAALLIEPSHSSPLPVETRASLIEDLWPTIQEANMKCPAHARISKSRIFFTTPKKPMHRAAKGTVQRKFTLDDYSEEIDALYADDDHSHLSSDVHKLDLDSLEQHVLQIIRSTTDITDLNVEDDFFSRGVDSVQTIQIYRCLRSGLQQNRVVVPAFAPSTIYTNPTASQLAAALRKLLNKVQTAEDIDENKRLEEMNSMLNEYATSLPDARVYSKNIRKSNPRVVLLTGSTGSFGSYLLEALVTCESIQKIYCLNRSVDPKRRQIERSTSQGLSTQWDSERVVFLTGNLTEDCMGIERQQYTELLENLDLVIHNSWQVDFNLSLSSYNHHHVQGVRKLIDLSIASTRNAKIFFMSTVSAVNNWLFKHESPVPEEWIKDFTAPAKMGYAESKHVSEQLLFTANERCNVPIAICRVGQIAGPALGEKRGWNKREWLPSLIISSRHLGIIPDSLGKIERVDWIPIDIFSTIIMELALGVQATSESAPRVYHAVNPRVTTWNALLPCIKTGTDVKLEVVPLPVWVEKLRASAVATMTEEDFEANPALKLVEFYESLIGTEDLLPLLETGKAQERSPTLRALAPVNEHWIGRWMKQWRTA